MGAEIEDKQLIVDNILKVLPEKAARDRRKHIVVRDCAAEQHIEADDKVIPGILTNRGCAFAGTKGVVFGPIKDMVHLVHGPIGCAYFTWGTRRNLAKAEEGEDNYMNYSVCTDMKETDIVFGGEKKLKKAIDEVVKIFNPGAITICALSLPGAAEYPDLFRSITTAPTMIRMMRIFSKKPHTEPYMP